MSTLLLYLLLLACMGISFIIGYVYKKVESERTLREIIRLKEEAYTRIFLNWDKDANRYITAINNVCSPETFILIMKEKTRLNKEE